MTWSVNSLKTHPIDTRWLSLKGRSMITVDNLQAELTERMQ